MEAEQMTSQNDPAIPIISTPQLQLLESLTNACAVSGDEAEVRSIVLEQLKPVVADLHIDALGNVLAIRPGKGDKRLRVMLAAHMDEVGLMLTNDEEDGLFRFDTVGGLDSRHLVGKAVWVGRAHTPGVIGAKAVHLTTAEERRQTISLDNLRIDLGPGGSSKAHIGDRAVFATQYVRLGDSVRAKALDNRLGVATLIELVKHAPDNIDLLAAFTVQEEVGLRGAKVAAYFLNPDLAIVLDSTPANDLPAWDHRDGGENTRYNTRLGGGPAIYIADNATLSDPRLVRHLVACAEQAGLPYQMRQPGGGGTDAGEVHKQRSGVPTVSVSVPGRYAHTSAGIARLDDWRNTLALVYTALARLDNDLLAVER
jgi:endoglucanase